MIEFLPASIFSFGQVIHLIAIPVSTHQSEISLRSNALMTERGLYKATGPEPPLAL